MSKRIRTHEQIERQRMYEREQSAAKAIAEGREPGHVGRPKLKFTEEEKIARHKKRREQMRAWRLNNLERVREIGRESMRRAAAKKALAEDREPGKIGRPAKFTAEEKRAKRKAKAERHNALHLEAVRERARLRQQGVRAGTFVSRALPRLTEEERKLKQRIATHKRRALLAASKGRYSLKDILRLYELQEGICTFCSKPLGDEWHVDHWFPLSLGGSNDRLNLRLLHENCNLVKGARHPSEFPLLQPAVLVWP